MMNKSLLIGRLTAPPELRKTPSDKSVVRVTLAVNRQFKNADGEREADFISVVIWGKSAEMFASYAKKGSLVSIEGEIRSRRYEDKAGVTHYVTEILCHQFNLLESRAAVALRENQVETLDVELEAEELPF
ncbi:single-stranded DNA-binding protein [Lactococcus hodotermopsidis]|uniref:Single-stranded DNA-binding protein n=1 Tax=Pseudolactococcus hodotermopsidis TaxID=2709157 RepID=A0A6A0BFH0_9LACT|nr:single-stranded DNA-binding protein [Lactococcus hodotermopsidis]GFH43455.1 single-stranded DNA-binding protein [Lactococcus hodotermopsidis]